MFRSLLAAVVLSFVVIAGQAFAGSAPTALISYLNSTEGLARFESLITSPEKLAQVKKFVADGGARDAEISKALSATGAERAKLFRDMIDKALERAAADPAVNARVETYAKAMIGVSDAELNRVASLQLPASGTAAGRASLTRGNAMPGQKFGPPMPTGLGNTQGLAALMEDLAQAEKAEGGLPAGFENIVKDPELVGEGMFDACLKGPNGEPLEAAPRHVLEKMIASADQVPTNVANRDLAVTEAAIKVGMDETFRDREEEVDAVDTLANQCGYLGARYARGIALIRAGAI